MIKNFLLAAWRGIMKNQLFTILNVSGLAVAICAAVVLTLFARHELSYDRFHEKSEQIFMVYKERITPNGIQPAYDTWVPLLEQMQHDFPEVKSGTRAFNDNISVSVKDTKFNDLAIYVDTTFLDVFTFPMAQGDPQNPFPTLNSVVISEEAAEKYFGTSNPLDQEFAVNFNTTYTVSGVLKKIPANSSIDFDVIIPIISHPSYARVEKSWGGSFLNTYILLDNLGDPEVLEAKFPAFIEKIWDEETRKRTNFKLLPLLGSYDAFIGENNDSYILLFIALGILIIASINFINLTTAGSTDRSKEVGMRKVLGSAKTQIATQFMTEAAITIFTAMVLGILLAKMTIPWINELFEMGMSLELLDENTIGLMVSFLVVLTILSGSYPAFFISRFRIIDSLKGTLKAGGAGMRKTLVIFQFTLSLLLIIATLIIREQILFMKSSDLSYDKNNLLIIPVSAGDYEDRDDAILRMQTFRDEVVSNSNILSMSTSTHVPSRWSGSNTFVKPEGWEGDPMRMRYTYHDADFFETFKMDLLDGIGFLPDSEGDQRESVVINESALNAFGFQDIDNKAIQIGDNRIQVVGVIRDFHFESLKQRIAPILHFHRVPTNVVHQYITLRINAQDYMRTLQFLEEKWQIISVNDPFNYFFLDESVNEMYAAEDRMLKMVSTFTLITIFIACLGLFGLTSFTVHKRKREMGIRKVLGASGVQLVMMISKGFMILIIAGSLLAIPAAVYLMDLWLSDFAYAIEIKPMLYLMSLLLVLIIGWGAVSFKAFQAARLNPAITLKDE